jgi:hypothetical protein
MEDIKYNRNSSHTRREFKTVTELVENLLENDVRCRNDDKWLTYRVMRYFTNIYIPFEDFKKIPAFETIKRCRAKIQNVEKRFPPTDPKVIIQRKVRARVIRKWSKE